jgi:hypothetical protein
MVQIKVWQMTLFQNLLLFRNHYGNLQEMLEMASFLKYVGLYVTNEWGRFYMGHSVPPDSKWRMLFQRNPAEWGGSCRSPEGSAHSAVKNLMLTAQSRISLQCKIQRISNWHGQICCRTKNFQFLNVQLSEILAAVICSCLINPLTDFVAEWKEC